MAIAISLHVLFSVVWVGGMIFAQLALRPVIAAQLQASQQATFSIAVLERFFWLVWPAVIILPVTGYWIIFAVYGGMKNVGIHIHLMSGIGMIMVAIFIFLFFAVFMPLKKAVTAGAMERARLLMSRLRGLIWTNLILGVITVLVASGGAYLRW